MYDLTPNKRHLELTIEHISTLALACFFTGNQAYGDRARQKAVVWFMDPETAMVAKYAGRLAGVRRGGTRFGRPEGSYDMRGLPELLNGVTLLASTPVWSETDTAAMAACVPSHAVTILLRTRSVLLIVLLIPHRCLRRMPLASSRQTHQLRIRHLPFSIRCRWRKCGNFHHLHSERAS